MPRITETSLLVAGLFLELLWLLLGNVSMMKDALFTTHEALAVVGPPWLAWIGGALIVAAAIWWVMRRLVWQLPNRYQFEAEFSDPRNEDARDGLIVWAERAYDLFLRKDGAAYASKWPLDTVVAKASAPNYPNKRDESLRQWAMVNPNNWREGTPEHILWMFCTWAHSRAHGDENDHEMTSDHFHELRRCRRVTAKFWDRWARALCRDRLRLKDVEMILHSNRSQIRLAAYLEAAHALHASWDDGVGKVSLFELAKLQDGRSSR